MEKQRETMQEIAIKLAEEQVQNQISLNGPRERCIFIIGSQNVGKSTIINRYLDREEGPKSTLALEYSYGRRSSPGQGVQKQICHVWELGTIVNSEQLLEIPFRSHGFENMSVIIMVDLSQPQRLWNDLMTILQCLKKVFQMKSTESIELMRKMLEEQYAVLDHADVATLDVFPIPMYIIGGKYDLFQDRDPEIKKQVCRCLRATAHLVGASVFFYTNQNNSMGKTLRDIFNHCGFGSPGNPIRNLHVDYNGPLSVSFGKDSWDKIGTTPENLEGIGAFYSAKITQEDQHSLPLPPDPANDAGFREAAIDEIRAHKNEEIHTLQKHSSITAIITLYVCMDLRILATFL
ncbi:cytoplasmic dynein 2 light intermediate chain 1 [Lutzomyia longipalpis]|uniref:cytoplasmic dynein 2 light intermediate chain 1 n=1 Tax=Lutzomyia longipalpis TaxID=7200 RepID=UPI0024835A62|nr:cytoplasmic dynein 2 light intermediate chain 1 [Lutzomyia longipalpis]